MDIKVWIKHLHKPLVFVGFIMMIFAGVGEKLPANLGGQWLKFLFILGLVAIIGGVSIAFLKVLKKGKQKESSPVIKGNIHQKSGHKGINVVSTGNVHINNSEEGHEEEPRDKEK